MPACAAGAWQQVVALRAASKNATAYDEMLFRAVSMRLPPGVDAHQAYPDTTAAWERFQSLFGVLSGLITYEPVWNAYVDAALDALKDDGVMHAELRANLFGFETYDLQQKKYGFAASLKLFHAGAAKRGMTVRFIWSEYRLQPVAYVAKSLAAAQRVFEEKPELGIVAFDLVGPEDRGVPGVPASNRSLLHYADVLLSHAERAGGPRLPFCFHAGETDSQGGAADANLFDALLLNTTRIGHGYSARHHPLLLQEAAKRGVAIEVCPYSNQALGLVGDLRNHALATLANFPGLGVVISSDDPGMWGLSGVTHDWYAAALIAAGGGGACAAAGAAGAPAARPPLALLKALALNSIDYSLVGSADKARMHGDFQVAWAAWVSELVTGAW